MQIVQAVFGVFHHFELAHQLHQRGHLRKLYSTWPWARLKREGLAHDLVGTFPLIHTTDYLLNRTRFYPRALSVHMNRWNALAFDRYTARNIGQCDAFIGISGAGLGTGQLIQRRGGVFICDRGSTHQRHQQEVLDDEFRRWKLTPHPVAEGVVEREEAIYEIADAITVPSESSKRSFIMQGVPAEKVHVIPYGVRLDQFKPSTRPDKSCFDVLFAGQVSLRKGIPYLLQAFAAVRHPNKHLRLAGSVTPEIRKLLADIPNTDKVEFLGSVPPPKLAEWMSRSHLLVLPSIEDGYGLVVPQAMACGCPVLASSEAGGSELIEEGVNGFICGPRDIAAMTTRMQQLVDDPDLQVRMGLAALERVKAIGGWDAYGQRWDTLLHRLTGLPQDPA